MPLKGMGSINLFIKRKPSNKIDRPPKKPKVMMGSTAKETSNLNKLPPSPCSGKGKRFNDGLGSCH